jgi:hypothetical protein
MKTDRELLGFAAKASGIEIGEWHDSANAFFRVDGGQSWWNPLEDDGEALRLAVRLRLDVCIRGHECEVFSDDEGDCLASEPIWYASAMATITDQSPYEPFAATRRAIVRAAAAIGESK